MEEEEEEEEIFSTTITKDQSGKISTIISYEVSKNGEAVVKPSTLDMDEMTTTINAVARDFVRSTNVIKEKISPIVSSSLLITASTIGASCLVLPEMAAGPGIAATSLVSWARTLRV